MSRFHQNCWKLLETNQESLLGHVTLRVRFHTLGCIIIRNMYVHVRECINPLTLPAAARLKRPQAVDVRRDHSTEEDGQLFILETYN